MTGMALGAGSEIAHQGVRAMMGGSGSGHGGQGEAPQQQQQQAPMQGGEMQQQQTMPMEQQQHPCAGFNANFMNCLKQSTNEIGMCQNYMDMLKQCEQDNSMGYQQNM